MSRIFQKWESAIFSYLNMELEHRWCMAVVSSCVDVYGSVLQRAQPSSLVTYICSLRRLRAQALRKVRMTSSQHAPYTLGDTRNTMVETIRSYPARARKSAKLNPSSDCRLQPAYMKPESLVIASQPYGGEYVPRICTHRPSHQESIQRSKSLV
jgi:hypothetical protein